MKKLFSFLAVSFLVLALVLPSSVFAATAHTWGERVPSGSYIDAWSVVATDDTGVNLIASQSTGHNYFISNDGGDGWVQLPEFPSTGGYSINTYIASDADGSNLIVGAYNQLLYTSNDGGDTWTERQPSGEETPGDWRVASDDDGSTLFVSHSGFDMYVSHDSGVTWEPSVGPAGGGFAVAVDADGSNLVAGEFGGNLHVSTDGGDSWQPTSLTGNFWTIASDDDGSNLIVTNSTGLFISDDGGDTWTERQPGGAPMTFAPVSSDADGSHLTAAGYTSDDGGVTWIDEPIGSSSTIVVDDDGTNFLAVGDEGGLYTSPDAVAPTIVSFTPADDATEVAPNTTFDIVFDEDIATSTGDITLHLVSDDSLVETIDIAGPKVTLSDIDTLTIDPTTTLETATEYYFLVDAGAIEDIEGNPFAGISDPTTWSFTTDTAPTLSSLTPLDDATDVALNLLSNGSAYAQFDQNVVAGTGNVTLKKASDNSTVVALDVNDPEGYVYFDSTTISLYYPVDLEYATDYYFLIDATAIEDENGNAFVGIADTTTWNFTTRDAPLPPTFDFERVSINDDGVEGDDSSYYTGVSGDGRYVVFSSDATNLVLDDTNDVTDVFVYDRDTNIIERVSVDDNGVESDDESGDNISSISSDGRFVAFSSSATNLVLGDTNNSVDIFVYDRDTDTIERVSVDDGGLEADNNSDRSTLSSDGRFVAFSSNATNLVPDDTNDVTDVFVYDRDTDTIERVSVDDGGVEADSSSSNPTISSDGRFVAFSSNATNLVPDDTNDVSDVFVYDRDTDTIERVSVDDDGVEGDGFPQSVSISSDGRFVAFSSSATNLTDDVVNGNGAVFLRDRTLGTTELIGTEHFEGDGSTEETGMSGDGRYVVYTVYDESEDDTHLYRFDTQTDVELLITEGVGNVDGYTYVERPSISSDGSVIVFQSENTDVVDDDTNGVVDIFVWEEVVEDEETPPAEEEEDGGGRNSSHRRSGGGSSSNGDAALLESLLTRVQELKAILASLLGTPSTTLSDYTRDLDIGDVGDDVRALQNFLITQNKGPQAQALAAVGATGFFGPLTQAALAEYQASVGITPAVGFFGPVTRAYVNGL